MADIIIIMVPNMRLKVTRLFFMVFDRSFNFNFELFEHTAEQ